MKHLWAKLGEMFYRAWKRIICFFRGHSNEWLTCFHCGARSPWEFCRDNKGEVMRWGNGRPMFRWRGR